MEYRSYGGKAPSVRSMAPSIYSHHSRVTTRSSANLRSTHSMRSVVIPWYRKPILQDAVVLDIQRASLITGCYSLFLGLFTLFTSAFDIYCLAEAAPGSTHYGYYIISFEFVYVGNMHVRNSLVVFALFSLIGSIALIVTSIMLIVALRKEYEGRMVPWLYCMFAFTAWRFFAFVFSSIVNDLYFGYNLFMCLAWIVFTVASAYGWVLVYSLYLELADLTKLEDLAHLRMGTMQSLNASIAHSIGNSRPTTPHSTISATPIN
ncbi:uncharacterized protein LOC132199977 [Neocloeon triangulifer]|uniref:uncharacterized protein LOC132199977 n=1 Tax=Neocloeon triangulifer TaxID=2078957 RepID=UPI00286EBC6C|nr:uncharacterized protein LOC132199977 [Neocloeon triangulifer]